MKSFKSNIEKQINNIPKGRIFTYDHLSFSPSKFAHVGVILSHLTQENLLIRIEKGAYYRPESSILGLGNLPVYQEEKLNYITKKLDGYLTGPYIYNKLSLTGQVPSIFTIAVRNPVRAFKFEKLQITCVKAYVDTPHKSQELYLVRLLDAIKDCRFIPGTSPQTAYSTIYHLHFSSLDFTNLTKIASLAKEYPPRVRKVLSRMLHDRGYNELAEELLSTICPTTKFILPYT